MATSSLGRLTLDLAVKLGSYLDGMTKAERKTQDSTNKMSKAMSGFKAQVMDALSGTQIGSVFSDFNDKFGSLKGGALIAGAALAGMAAGGVTLAMGALSKMAIEAAKADSNLQMLANRTNTTVRDFQVLEHAALQFGVSQDQLSSILSDTQEKLGEFTASEGGGASDFFEALKNNTKMTEDQIRSFAKTLSGKDGIDAIRAISNELDKLDVTKQERRFIFESLASDLGHLAPIFANNAQLLDEFDAALEKAGILRTKEAVEQSRVLAAQTQSLQTRFEGFKSQLTAQMMPALNGLLSHFMKGATDGKTFGTVINSVGVIAKGVGAIIIGVAGAIELIIIQIKGFIAQARNIGQTAVNVWNADGFAAKGVALITGVTNSTVIAQNSFKDSFSSLKNTVNGAVGMFDGAYKEIDDLAKVYHKANNASLKASEGIKTNTKVAEENAKAAEKQAKAQEKANKELSLSAVVQANAAKYGFGSVEKKYNLPSGALSAIHAIETGNSGKTSQVNKSTGATGGFQFLKGTADQYGVKDRTNLAQSAEGAGKYLSYLLGLFKGDLEKAVRAYHAGEGNVQRGTNLGKFNNKYWADFQGYTGAQAKSEYSDLSSVLRQSEDIYKAQQSVIVRYQTEREKIESEHAGRLSEIQMAFATDKTSLELYTNLQKQAYSKDVAEFNEAQSKKIITEKKALLEVRRYYLSAEDYAREYYALIREEILATSSYSPEMKHALVKEANFNQGMDENADREQVWGDYQSMMGLDKSPYQQDMDLLAEARAHMLLTEDEYQQQRLAMQMTYGTQYGADFAGMMMGLVDSSSSAYAILGGIQKGAALFSTAMNSYTAISAAWASAPFPYNLPAVGMATMETGLLQAAISAMSPVGMAHNGIDNIPKEGTWLLDGGERVLNPQQNKDLTGYLDAARQQNSQTTSTPQNIAINNILDPSIVGDFMGTSSGTKTFMNFIKNNRSSIKAMIA